MPAPLKGPDQTTPIRSLREVLAYNVRVFRVLKGLSQEKLGFLAELDRTFVSQVERAKINISLDSIEKLAQSLEVEPSLLFVRPSRKAGIAKFDS